MKITKRQLRQIIRESIEQQLYVIPDHQLKKLYQYYTGRKSDHLQAISLADAYKIDHAGLIGQIMDWLNKGGHLNADSDGYEFAYIMGYNFMKFYGDDHPVDEYAFAPYEREFEEGAYEYLVDEYRKTDPGPQGFDEDMPRGERIIEEGIIGEARQKHYQPDLMSAYHNNGRPTELSIALDIAWQDILDYDDMFGSPRFKTMDRYNRSQAYKVGYYTFFRRVAETNRVPGMGFAGQNPSREGVMRDIEKYSMMDHLIKNSQDERDAVKGFTKAFNVVDQMRIGFYRGGPRPETWSS
tara:strand:- start:5047 stop:5934 length:888 start_codon:yes stop_codon:yes gene_type:complete